MSSRFQGMNGFMECDVEAAAGALKENGGEPSPARAAYIEGVRRNYHWNFAATVTDGMAIVIAIVLIGPIIYPVYYNELFKKLPEVWHRNFNTILGIFNGMVLLSLTLPAFFAAWWGETLPNKSRIVFALGWAFRIQWLAYFASAAFLAEHHPALAVIVPMITVFLGQIGQGVNWALWVDYIGKIFPSGKLGKVHGWRTMTGGFSAIAGLFLAIFLMDKLPFPSNFIVIFGIAAIMTTVSQVSLLLTRETSYPVHHKREKFSEFYGRFIKVFKRDERLRRVVTSYAFHHLALGFGAVPLLISFIAHSLQPAMEAGGTELAFGYSITSIGQLGFIVALVMTGFGGMTGGAIYGRIYDRLGLWWWRLLMTSGFITAYGWLLLASRPWEYLAAMFLFGIHFGANGVGLNSVANTIAPGSRRMSYHLWILLTMAMITPASALAGFIGDKYGLKVSFTISLVFWLLNLVYSAARFPRIVPSSYDSDSDKSLREIAEKD